MVWICNSFSILKWIFLAGILHTITAIVIQHPQSFNAPLNSTAFLQCKVSVEENMQVAWMKSGFGIGDTRDDIRNFMPHRYHKPAYDLPGNVNEGDYTLQINNVQLCDEGKYKCQQTIDGTPLFLSHEATLSVLVPSLDPELHLLGNNEKLYKITPNNSISVDEGKTMYLRCAALGGKPGARLYWSVGGQRLVMAAMEMGNGTFTGPIEGFFRTWNESSINSPSRLMNCLNGDTFTVDSFSEIAVNFTRKDHGRMIECKALNEGYEKYHISKPVRAFVHINYPPKVKIFAEPSREDNLYNEHDLVRFYCQATARPNEFTWEWRWNGALNEYTRSNEYRIHIGRYMNGSVVECKANNGLEGTASLTISVRYGPQFIDKPNLYSASIGDPLIMECDVDSNPLSSIVWRKEDMKSFIHWGNTLERSNVLKSDFGMYTCTANNSLFSPIIKQILLGEKSPPRITSSPVVYARHGKYVRMPCIMYSVPLPPPTNIIWKKSGQILPPNNILYSTNMATVDSSLIIQRVTTADFGSYNCSVNNTYGTDWQIITLTPIDDFPLAFIAGALVAIVLTLLVIVCIFCSCHKGDCGKKYHSYLHGTYYPPEYQLHYGVDSTRAAPNGNAVGCGSESENETACIQVLPHWTPSAGCPLHSGPNAIAFSTGQRNSLEAFIHDKNARRMESRKGNATHPYHMMNATEISSVSTEKRYPPSDYNAFLPPQSNLPCPYHSTIAASLCGSDVPLLYNDYLTPVRSAEDQYAKQNNHSKSSQNDSDSSTLQHMNSISPTGNQCGSEVNYSTIIDPQMRSSAYQHEMPSDSTTSIDNLPSNYVWQQRDDVQDKLNSQFSTYSTTYHRPILMLSSSTSSTATDKKYSKQREIDGNVETVREDKVKTTGTPRSKKHSNGILSTPNPYGRGKLHDVDHLLFEIENTLSSSPVPTDMHYSSAAHV